MKKKKKRILNKWHQLVFIGKDIKVYIDGVKTDDFPLEFWVREPVEVMRWGEKIQLFKHSKLKTKEEK